MIHKIGILTSGGDAPGMNAAIIGAIKTGIALHKEMYVVYDGYKGLIDKNFVKVDGTFAQDKLAMGGTCIKTKRLPEFKEDSTQLQAVANLKEEGIDALIVIGGDGSYMGAKKLTEKGINCIGIPATIDNDISSTEVTMGFDTSLNTVVNALDNIKVTSSSHNRCAVVEIMGNKCPDLTLYAGIATDADYILTADNTPNVEEAVTKMIAELKEYKKTDPDHVLILVAEKLLDVHALGKRIMAETGFDTRSNVLGHMQRGGEPTAMERIRALRMGSYAIELLDNGIGGVCLGTDGDKLVYHDIYEALKMPRDKHEELYKIHELIK